MSAKPVQMRVSERKRVLLIAQRAEAKADEAGAAHNSLVDQVDNLTAQAGRDITRLGGLVTRLQVETQAFTHVLEQLKAERDAEHGARVELSQRSLWQRIAALFRAVAAPDQPVDVVELYESKCEELYHECVIVPSAKRACVNGLLAFGESIRAAAASETAGAAAGEVAPSADAPVSDGAGVEAGAN